MRRMKMTRPQAAWYMQHWRKKRNGDGEPVDPEVPGVPSDTPFIREYYLANKQIT